MSVSRRKVVLKGGSQVVPWICPNCLHKAEVDLRYCYIRPWDVLRPTRFFQSFRTAPPVRRRPRPNSSIAVARAGCCGARAWW